MFVNGEPLQVRPTGRGAEMASVGYQATILRVKAELGIDQVNTLTVTFAGVEAAKLVKERFAKLTTVKLQLGYDDHPQDYQIIAEGHAVQAYPTGTNPVEVDLEVDSLMYQAREDRNTADDTDPSQAMFIQSRLAAQPTSITCNLAEDQIDGQEDEGGTNEGESSLLDYIQRWTKANYVHWVDRMDGEVKFFYPGAKVDFYREWRTWDLSVRKTKDGDSNPPILSEWSPRQSFVEAPYTLTANWYDSKEPGLITPVLLTATNERGLPDSELHIGPLYTKEQADAQAILDAAADDYYWNVIEGGFAISAGIPIMPLDDIIARNGPPGLEEYYDRAFEVVKVTHTLDARGWTTSGEIRGGR